MIACGNRKLIVNRFCEIINLAIPFHCEPDFGVMSVNYDFAELLARAERLR